MFKHLTHRILLLILDSFQELEERVDDLEDKEKLMATKEDVKAAVAEAKSEAAAAIDRGAADVAELKRKIEEGSGTPAEFDSIVADLKAVSSALKGLDPLPEFPAPPVPTATEG